MALREVMVLRRTRLSKKVGLVTAGRAVHQAFAPRCSDPGALD
jgi:hypothetical protein